MNFNEAEVRTVAEISRDVGQVIFAIVFLEPIISGRANQFTILGGIILVLISWYVSIRLSK